MTRTLRPAQRCCVYLGGPDLAAPQLLFETRTLLLEAPNWSLDGSELLLNGDGVLWRLSVEHPQQGVRAVAWDGLPPINNDHVLDPDGHHVYLSADDGHIYRGSLAGGAVTRITPDDGRWHFLHGVSPSGSQLAYVEIDTFDRPGRLMLMPSSGGAAMLLDAGRGHHDGPEWSPDGAWVLYNTEAFTSTPGHAQLARLPAGGGAPERLTTSDTVDWFPHLSPDGAWGSYLAFPPGTLGHPADREVVVHVVAPSNWNASVRRYAVAGGQGTLNVNSWSPDSRRFAFVGYPFD
jgi:TolB protein